MYEPSPITITKQDDRRLRNVAALYSSHEAAAAISLLEELERAVIVESTDVAPSIVTMNSRVTCRMESGHLRVVELVYPRRADASRGLVSVLAPLGRALLGATVGERIEVVVGRGRTSTWTIESIAYQPEAAGDYDL